MSKKTRCRFMHNLCKQQPMSFATLEELDLLDLTPKELLEVRWDLKATNIRKDGWLVTNYLRVALTPVLTKELYMLPSVVTIEKAMKPVVVVSFNIPPSSMWGSLF